MITLPKLSPTIYNQSELREFIKALKGKGTRILLLSSNLKEERESIELIKKEFISNSITYIDQNITKINFNKEELTRIINRSRDFMIQAVLSIGTFNQHMAGRFINNELNLPLFEIYTNLESSYTLIPEIVIPARSFDKFNSEELSDMNLEILFLEKVVEAKTQTERVLCSTNIIFELANTMLSSRCSYCYQEAKFLINRILEIQELTTKELIHLNLTAAQITGLNSGERRDLSLISRLLSYRLNIERSTLTSKLIPWILEDINEELLANRVREKYSEIGGRISELGPSLNQIFSVELEDRSARILDLAY